MLSHSEIKELFNRPIPMDMLIKGLIIREVICREIVLFYMMKTLDNVFLAIKSAIDIV